jgi:hypothetical protein
MLNNKREEIELFCQRLEILFVKQKMPKRTYIPIVESA